MLEYGITMTRLSKDDLIDIGDYIAYTLGVPDTALQFIEGIREVISTLSQTPERGALIRDKVLSEQGVKKSIWEKS